MSQKIIAQLKELKHDHDQLSPNKEWVSQSRQRLMSQIQNSMGQKPESSSWVSSFETFLKLFVSAKTYYFFRTTLIFVLAIGITVGGWIGGVSASHKCLPGEFCYNVKLAAEKTQLAVASVTGNTDSKVALHLEFASRRLEEIPQVKDVHQTEAVKEFKKSLTSISNTLDEVKNGDQEKAIRVATDITKKTSDIARTLSHVTQTETSVSLGTVKEMADATKLVNETGIQALQIALQGQPSGAPSEDIKALVSEKIDTILDANKNAQALISDVTTSSISGATSTLVSIVLTTRTTSSSNVVTSTDSATPTTTPSLSEAIQKVDQNAAAAELLASEAKALLEGNKVEEAFEKVKTLNILTTETSEDVVQVQETLSESLGLPPLIPSLSDALTSTTTVVVPQITSSTTGL